MHDKPYLKDNKEYEHITNILDYFSPPGIVEWKLKVGKKEARRISTIAINIGNNVDEAIKADVQGLKLPKLKTQEAKNCYQAYLDWKKDYSPELTVAETVYDDENMVAGTPDLWLDGCVIDIKCSSEIRDNYWLQTEFYARKATWNEGSKAILRLEKNLACYEYKKQSLNDEHWEVVQGLIKAYRYYNNKTEQAPQKEEV